MSIVASEIYDDKTQANGLRDIIELHTDHLGGQRARFLSDQPADYDAAAAMAAHAKSLDDALAESEKLDAVDSLASGDAVLGVVSALVDAAEKDVKLAAVDEHARLTVERDALSARIERLEAADALLKVVG